MDVQIECGPRTRVQVDMNGKISVILPISQPPPASIEVIELDSDHETEKSDNDIQLLEKSISKISHRESKPNCLEFDATTSQNDGTFILEFADLRQKAQIRRIAKSVMEHLMEFFDTRSLWVEEYGIIKIKKEIFLDLPRLCNFLPKKRYLPQKLSMSKFANWFYFRL